MVRPDQAVRAHPRSRGENLRSCRPGSKRPGSSPLTRGKPHPWNVRQRRQGLIPAHAGKTRSARTQCRPRTAHPRSRGENKRRHRSVTSRSGSSPLTRGKRLAREPRQAQTRLIPAHAGKTQTVYKQISQWSAHPRSRGENLAGRRATSPDLGSSPLTRGKPSLAEVLPQDARLIPAHAGKTACTPTASQRPSAHPRSRGENLLGGSCGHSFEGSSPLTRGKLRGRELKFIPKRLIPAHAGKTFYVYHCFPDRRAHPRSRGENRLRAVLNLLTDGSSPLTRGKPTVGVADGGTDRLIPAHAGKTQPVETVIWSRAAHPRSRGENGAVTVVVSFGSGSSPLTRGKRAVGAPVLDRRGLIPAHAGKTEGKTLLALSFPGSSPLTRGKLGCPLRTDQGQRLIPAHAGKTTSLLIGVRN